jgi:hypothetical protein
LDCLKSNPNYVSEAEQQHCQDVVDTVY